MGIFDRFYEIVSRVPEGKVTTYGTVARLAGNPRMSRQVGWALHANPRPGEIPCHRVLNRAGEPAKGFAFGGKEVQRGLLTQEGVAVSEDGVVDLSVYGWPEQFFGKPVENR